MSGVLRGSSRRALCSTRGAGGALFITLLVAVVLGAGACGESPTHPEISVASSCDSIDPYFAEVGAPATTFLCRGEGFLPVTEVYLDSAAVEWEYLDSRTLRFIAPAELLAEPGTRTIRVRNPGQDWPGWTVGRSLHVLHSVVVGSGGRQLGDGCIIDAYGFLQCWDIIPRPVAPHLRFQELRDWCAITTSGAAYCWGYNNYGQLGTGLWETWERRTSAPDRPIAGELDLHGLAVGVYHACALTIDGAAWCWGSNSEGQLGTDEELEPCASDVPCAPQPVPVAGDLRFVAVAAARSHTCGIEAGGTAYCWGSDENGQLGTGPGRTDSPSPQPVDSDVRFASIKASFPTATCALTAEGAAYCWGGGNREVPTPVAEGLRFETLAEGMCGLTFEGELYCFFPLLWRVDDEHSWTEIRVGPSALSFCGFTTEHRFLCWGGWGGNVSHINFPLVHEPDVCFWHRPGQPGWRCYRSPTAVFGVAGQASAP
jgi:hypothetical protein